MFKRLSITAALSVALLSGTADVTSAQAITNSTGDAHPFMSEIHTQPQQKVYVVRAGDTLSGIAKRLRLSWEKLYCENLRTIGKSPGLIFPGEKLKEKESNRVWCHVPSVTPAQSFRTTAQAVSSPVSSGGNFTGYGGFQSCVIQRESGGDPTAYNISSGASGLYGFLLSTWMSTPYGASYPGGAYTAPVSVQNEAFSWLYAKDGPSPWSLYDGC